MTAAEAGDRRGVGRCSQGRPRNEAVDLLLAGDLQASPITEYVMIESPLVVRESTGACP